VLPYLNKYQINLLPTTKVYGAANYIQWIKGTLIWRHFVIWPYIFE